MSRPWNTLDLALNEATRAGLGIGQPLIDLLDATAHAENFLVIDAAERLSHGCALKAKALIEELIKRNTAGAKAGWRVLIGADGSLGRRHASGAGGCVITEKF